MQISRLIPSARLGVLAPLLLLVIGLAVFANSLNGTFVFDDAVWLSRGDIKHLWQPSSWMVAESEGPAHGRPVAAFTLAANFAWGARAPFGYHVVNLAIHLACSLLLYGVIRQSLRRPPLASAYARNATGLAFAIALLWTIHPLQTECVNYISQRTTTLAALFYLATFYCSIRADRSRRALAWGVLASVCCWIGVGCKEIIVTAPFLVALYDFCYRPASTTISQLWRRRWPLYAGLCSSWIPLAMLLAWQPRSRTVGSHLVVTPLTYAMNQCVLLVEYVQLIFWPRTLAIDYGCPQPLSWTEVAPSAVALLLLLVATAYLLIRKPMVGFLGAWFFVILAPTSSFLPIITEVGAERRVYLSLAAPLALFVIRGSSWLTHLVGLSLKTRLTDEKRIDALTSVLSRSLGVALLILVTLLLGLRSHRRNEDYRSNLALWFSGVVARPENPRAHYNFAVQLSRCGLDKDAVDIYQRLLKRWPKHANALNNMAAHYDELGEFANAIEYYERSIAAAPEWDLPIRNLVVLLASCREAKFRDGPRARRMGRYLCNVVDGENATSFDALAAAYAECGEFEKAQRIARIGIGKARDVRDDAFADEIERRYQMYRTGKAFRSRGALGEPRRSTQLHAVAPPESA